MQAVNREGAGALSFLKIRSGKLFSGHSPFASLSKIYSADRDYLSHFSPRQGEGSGRRAYWCAARSEGFSPHVNHTATGTVRRCSFVRCMLRTFCRALVNSGCGEPVQGDRDPPCRRSVPRPERALHWHSRLLSWVVAAGPGSPEGASIAFSGSPNTPVVDRQWKSA